MITNPLWSERAEDVLNEVFPVTQMQRALVDEIKHDQMSSCAGSGYGGPIGHDILLNPEMFYSDRGITPGETRAIMQQWVAYHAGIQPNRVTIKFYRTLHLLPRAPFLHLKIDRMRIGYAS